MKVNTGTLVFCITFAVVSSAFGFHSPTRCAYQRKSCHHLPAYSEGESNEFSTSRRSMVQTLSLIPIFRPDSAFGAPPMTLGESDGLGARAERAMRAKPPKVLRTKLSQDFAVLLMRASYNALDQIDCIAMVRVNIGLTGWTIIQRVIISHLFPSLPPPSCSGSVPTRLFLCPSS